ncbi:MAG: ATP-binding protein [Clostridiales bacterium]|nr:ATP-binding protein [Clostridiales bacterium]
MNNGQGFSYQIYETYYRQAKEAYAAGRMGEARKMYFNAATSLLKTAKETDGEMKEALMRRSRKLMQLAESIPDDSDASGSPAAGEQRTVRESRETASDSRSRQPEEGQKVWRESGNPGVYFDDIAGLSDVKESIRTRVILPRLHPEVYTLFRREEKGGILLYGPPGTGKTMIAKAIATEIDAKFYSIRCSDIVGKYFGEAEKNVRGLFDTARQNENAILFFDEFEALAAKRGGNSTVMNRLVPELLSQIDGFQDKKQGNLLLIAATNRPWDIDSAFLRPPRLTEKIYVGLPDYEARLFIADKEFRAVPCEMENLPELIAKATDGCNAADIVAACGRIKDNAIRYVIDQTQKEGMVRWEDVRPVLSQCQSSVQQQDLEQIRRWEESQNK